MKKHKNLIIFLIITTLRSIFLGMSKIFLWAALKEDSRNLEEIAGYISLGAVLSYMFGGALTYTFRKKPIIIISSIIIIGCLLLGYFTDYFPFDNFAILITIMGFFYGLWLTVKGIITTTEILNSGRSETTINGITNIAIFIGLLLGSYRGFAVYDKLQGMGVIAIIAVMVAIIILTLFLKYDKEFKKHTIKSAIEKNIPNIFASVKKYTINLIPIGILRAITTAVGQKMLEIGIDVMKKTTTKGISVIVISMGGAILGHALSGLIKTRKKEIITLLTVLLGISVRFFPNFLEKRESFGFMTLYSAYLGIIFGVIINIIEGKFYHKIGDENRKEFGSTAYGIITSISIFLIMMGGDLVSKHIGTYSSFIFFGACILLCIPFIRKST